MTFECTNPDCGNIHTETSTTMRVRGGEVRYYNGSDDPCDICPKCGGRCKETTKKEGLPTMKFTDRGTGKNRLL